MSKSPSATSAQPPWAPWVRRRYLAIFSSSTLSTGSPRWWRGRMYSAGMVPSASSSNTQCPSACWQSSNACVAAAMLDSSASPLFSISRVLLPESMFSRPPVLSATGRASRCRRNSSSVLWHVHNVSRSTIARPHRPLDSRRQSRISPVARKKQVFEARHDARPQGVLFRRGLEGRSALAYDLPGRQFARHPASPADIPPNLFRQCLAWYLHQRVAVTDGHGKALRKGEQPLHQTTDHAQDRRRVTRWIDPKMRIHDGTEFRRRFQIRKQRGRRARRHGQHDGIIRPDRYLVVAAEAKPEVEPRDPRSAGCKRMQLVAEMDASALVLQQPDCGFDQHRAQTIASDQRATGLPARQQRLPHHRAGKPRRTLWRIEVQRGEQKRLYQPLIQRAVATDRFVNPPAPRCPDQRHQSEIVEQAGVGDTPVLVQHPKRQPAVAKLEQPALARREIDKGKLCELGTDQARLGSDRFGVSKRMPVAREQKMIAVVDGETGCRIEIGTAAPARLLRGLMDMHLTIRVGEPHGGGQAR